VRTHAGSLALRDTPNGVRSPAPCIGEHTDEVMRDLLGFTPDEIAAADGLDSLLAGVCDEIRTLRVNMGPCVDPQVAARGAQAAEAAGFDSLWAGEHIADPPPVAAAGPVGDARPDRWRWRFSPAHTKTVPARYRIIILPQRIPACARQGARLARRLVRRPGLTFGIGIGY